MQPFFIETKKNIEVCWRAGCIPTEISTKFGLNWLCEPGDKSYKPQYFFSISMKNGCLLTIVYKLIIRLAGKFFSYHYMLGTLILAFFFFSKVVGNKRSAEQLLTRVMRGNDFLIRALRSQNPVSHI